MMPSRSFSAEVRAAPGKNKERKRFQSRSPAGDCAAAATLQSERAAAIVKSLNFTACPPLARIGPQTIPQQSGNCAANQPGPVRSSEFILCGAQCGGGWGSG